MNVSISEYSQNISDLNSSILIQYFWKGPSCAR